MQADMDLGEPRVLRLDPQAAGVSDSTLSGPRAHLHVDLLPPTRPHHLKVPLPVGQALSPHRRERMDPVTSCTKERGCQGPGVKAQQTCRKKGNITRSSAKGHTS